MIEAARKRKFERYERLELKIKEKGLIVDNSPLEAAAREVNNARNSGMLAMLTKMFRILRFLQVQKHLGKKCTLRLRLGLVEEKIPNMCSRQFYSAMR